MAALRRSNSSTKKLDAARRSIATLDDLLAQLQSRRRSPRPWRFTGSIRRTRNPRRPVDSKYIQTAASASSAHRSRRCPRSTARQEATAHDRWTTPQGDGRATGVGRPIHADSAARRPDTSRWAKAKENRPTRHDERYPLAAANPGPAASPRPASRRCWRRRCSAGVQVGEPRSLVDHEAASEQAEDLAPEVLALVVAEHVVNLGRCKPGPARQPGDSRAPRRTAPAAPRRPDAAPSCPRSAAEASGWSIQLPAGVQ